MSNLAHKLLDNQGLIALTVVDEQKELRQIGRHKIKFAFFQKDFEGGLIPYWHVVDPTSPSFMSTLSIEGLREWNII